MIFKCPVCLQGSFTIATDGLGVKTATCNTCGTVGPFDKEVMQDDEPRVVESKTLHLKLASSD